MHVLSGNTIFLIHPFPNMIQTRSAIHSSNSTNCRCTLPLTTRGPRNRRCRRNPQIIHIRPSTTLLRIPLTSHRTHLCPRQTRRLRRRRHTPRITFSSIFEADVGVCCCWCGGETGQSGGNAEIGCHAVVAEELREVVSCVWSAGGVGEAAGG
jgi:hypothetical protein